MRVGLIDVDSHNYPNLPLMKISAFHKARGDSVEWYYPLISGKLDRVYMSKVFGFTQDYQYPIYAEKIYRGGSGYCIETQGGKETFDRSRNQNLPDEIEHIYPDYSIYPELAKDTAFGFLSRGCPRGCGFCHVSAKEGKQAHKVADLEEFWRGQKNIEILDPNITACKDWKDLFDQLAQSKACVNFNQGIDIRLMTEEKAEHFKKVRTKLVHFAWDKYEDGSDIIPKLEAFRDITGLDRHKVLVYILTNFNSTHERDLERINKVREIGFEPYVMIYDKENTRPHDMCRLLQRWCNNKWIFRTEPDFYKYDKLRR